MTETQNEWVDEKTLETAVVAMLETCETFAALKRKDGLAPSVAEVRAVYDSIPDDLYTTEPYKGIDTMLLKAVTIAALVCAEQNEQAKPSKWVLSERQRSILREMLRQADVK